MKRILKRLLINFSSTISQIQTPNTQNVREISPKQSPKRGEKIFDFFFQKFMSIKNVLFHRLDLKNHSPIILKIYNNLSLIFNFQFDYAILSFFSIFRFFPLYSLMQFLCYLKNKTEKQKCVISYPFQLT